MGLLDALNSRDGMFALGLLQAASPKPVRTGLGAGLLQAMQGAQSWEQEQEDRKQRAAMQALQMQHMQAQIGEAQAQAQQRQAAADQAAKDQDLTRQWFSPLAGPTQDGAPMAPRQFDPRAALAGGMSLRGLGEAMNLDHALTPQKANPLAMLGKIDPKDYTQESVQAFLAGGGPGALKAAPKESAPPSDWQLYQLSGAAARGIPFDSWDQSRRRAGAPSVSVSTGQHGFDNTLKLRGDFRGEPVYKAHQEMQSAYSQITQSLKQASPAGDLAGATKLMKLLDPGSVVRESELGMAMAATGLLDRVQNYASQVVTGQKLTPEQRADFRRLADSLYSESVRLYNTKRSEYQGIAERNGLNTQDVLGPPSATPAAGDGWGIKLKGQ